MHEGLCEVRVFVLRDVCAFLRKPARAGCRECILHDRKIELIDVFLRFPHHVDVTEAVWCILYREHDIKHERIEAVLIPAASTPIVILRRIEDPPVTELAIVQYRFREDLSRDLDAYRLLVVPVIDDRLLREIKVIVRVIVAKF